MGEEAFAIAWPGRLPTGFAGASFLPATSPPVRAFRPPAWPALLVLPLVLGPKEELVFEG